MTTPFFALYRFSSRSLRQEPEIPGFFVVSTALENVEDEEWSDPLRKVSEREKPNLLDGVEFLGVNPKEAIKQVAETLYKKTNKGQEDVEFVIAIHGYNTNVSSVKDWYQTIWQYANKNISSKNAVFLGYRWSSETLHPKNLFPALKSLPILLAALLYGGILGILLSLLQATQISLAIFTLCFAISGFLATLIVTLIILRIVVYFRDSYRATNFGVPDLVELFRQLNKALLEQGLQTHKIKLSFIAHSMGGFVTTNVVRILSDVFDSASVGELDCSNKAPSKDIGDVFCLSRLVLVSPDISAGTIVSGRSNFLQSSLRRFEEAYLFSNEGDLALRIASTAANYFSFPTSERKQGHRLGNVTVKPRDKREDPQYGVVNHLTLTSNPQDPKRQLVNYLEINTLLNSIQIGKPQKLSKPDEEIFPDLFTYFDCTNYRDRKYKKTGAHQHDQSIEELTDNEAQLLCYRLDRFPSFLSFLNAFVYARLLLDWGVRKVLDVHGGYFEGEFTRSTIYKLAFTGLQGLLICLKPGEQYVLNSMDREIAQVRQKLSSIRKKINELQNETSSTDNAHSARLKQLQAELEAWKQKSEQLHSERYKPLFETLSDECFEKQIQVAFSPERYESEVLGQG